MNTTSSSGTIPTTSDGNLHQLLILTITETNQSTQSTQTKAATQTTSITLTT